jgi:Uma2 family endonuclease
MRTINPDNVQFPEPATLSDLFRVKGKAELIADRVVCYPLMGEYPGHIKSEIMIALDKRSEELPGTEAFGGSLVYGVPKMPSGRQSFCPDASFHTGPFPTDRMKWIDGPPTFAVEIKVLEDYESDTEQERVAKRADYFEAGTLAVWDVDPLAETVTLYRSTDPLTPVVFRRGDTADAEPAVPGWRVAVDDLFA